MVFKWLVRLIGDNDDKKLSRLTSLVERINQLEPDLKKLSDEELRGQTEKFKARLKSGEATLDDILPEAFAAVREASIRTTGLRHFDVQLLGGIVLHQGKITEMKTGEGKTLVATLPVYLNALSGKGVHIITVNDYLARRDAEWMGPIYRALGMTVGSLQHDTPTGSRKETYLSDVVYGTNSEFGFDYLRDNMSFHINDCVQRELHFAIVDEVDSILIDEARTPLIISGMVDDKVDLYFRADNLVRKLTKGADFTCDEKSKNAVLTEEGIHKAEKLLNIEYLFDVQHMELAHQMLQSLRAHHLFKKDVDYVIKEGEIIIVDEFNGRLMTGRRYSDGLHQAIEAKEKVRIREESQTLATITLQNYFRLYAKLAGMTGTAKTEEMEFWKIYNLEVLEIPTNQRMIRNDLSDVIYKTKREKFNAVVNEIVERHKVGQPVLVGSISIENSEQIAELLYRKGVPHHVLNAKHHEQEAEIIARAGQPKAVTISTNMAGRGTDIVLGEGVADKGGLHVIGTERHESRRIDNQLRGRAGRQGDLGSTRFYVSLEDDLMRLFGSQRISGVMDRLGIEEGTPIEHPLISRALENAQKKVEQYHFGIRKQILEFDDVMNKQRDTVYSLRRRILEGRELKEKIYEMSETALGPTPELDEFKRQYEEKETTLGFDEMRELERIVMLKVIDTKWIELLDAMEDLKEGIGLRGYGGRDPLVEYKIEGYNMFQEMMDASRREIIDMIIKVQLMHEGEQPLPKRNYQSNLPPAETIKRSLKVGRNDPCPCGSGKKYKKCCGVNE
jgi:preprotein translocase subunit SecA